MAEPLPKRAPTLLDSLESRSSENLDIGLFVAQAVQVVCRRRTSIICCKDTSFRTNSSFFELRRTLDVEHFKEVGYEVTSLGSSIARVTTVGTVCRVFCLLLPNGLEDRSRVFSLENPSPTSRRHWKQSVSTCPSHTMLMPYLWLMTS